MNSEEGSAQGELAIARVGDRLRMAREAKGLTIADIAKRTRITTRHLEAIEQSDFGSLPGRTYISGFARAYARAVELPEAEIAAMVREEIAAGEYAARPVYEAYEPTDPARLPSRMLVWTLVAIVLLLASAYGVWRFISTEPNEVLTAAQNRAADAAEASATSQQPATAATGSPAQAISAGAPVVLTALSEVWIGFDDATGKTENWRTLDPGETYEIPPEYIQKFTLRTSIPQALKITVGGRDVGPIGPSDTLTKNISLKPADLIARANGNSGGAPAGTPSRPGR